MNKVLFLEKKESNMKNLLYLVLFYGDIGQNRSYMYPFWLSTF